jgi:hypothetical protein
VYASLSFGIQSKAWRCAGGKPPIDAFVEQDLHEAASIIRVLASSRKAMTCRHRWKPFEEIVDRLTGFEIVKQGLYRNSCPVKHGGAAHDFGAA